ncbi:galactosyltransferase-related protein [Roseomonas sp. 18066]|uniref:glycosyltransferase family 2 protein n=1 Tax=Roseomonas sp. 18066 TaxID=2681412 RepID=UPI00135CA474|nr:galactosyltransferase-related protein [Roseomonas sp. 18066]
MTGRAAGRPEGPDVAVLTLAKGRPGHLRNLLAGLAAGRAWPRRGVLIDLNDTPAAVPALPFPLRHEHAPAAGLPLAAARNRAAALAGTAGLIFLDVDCIPAPGLVAQLAAALQRHDALVCCEILYLPPGATAPPIPPGRLAALGRPHPMRPFPRAGLRREANAGLFWSLAFAIRRASFEALGGFDEGFTGYGAEDTDLAFRAAARGLPLLFTGETRAFHQHHPVFDPPLQHFDDILANAARFAARHGSWPMQGWLRDFAALGLIDWPAGGAPRLLRRPDPAELAAAACGPERLF